MRKLIAFLFILYSTATVAQVCNFSGKVFMQTSNKIVPVANVGLSGKNHSANLVHSKNNGEFCLLFDGFKPGAKIELDVESVFNGNIQIEIINDREMITHLPENKNDVVEVIICRKGEKQIAIAKFYNLLRTASSLELNQMREANAKLKMELGATNKRVIDDSLKIVLYEKLNDSLSFYKEAYKLASTNRRTASTRMLEFINLLEDGASLKEARKALSIELASRDGRQAATDFRSAMEELTRISSISTMLNASNDAESSLDSILVISESIGIKPVLLIDYYIMKADFLNNRGKFKEATKYLEKSIKILIDQGGEARIRLAELYHKIASYYSEFAEDYQSRLSDEEPWTKARIKKETAIVKGYLEEAIKYHKLAADIYEKLPNSEELAKEEYGDIAMIYQNMGKDWGAFKYTVKFIKAQNAQVEKENDEIRKKGVLINKYANIGNSFMSTGQYDSAIVYYTKLNEINSDYDGIHFKLGICFLKVKQYGKSEQHLLRVEHSKDTIINKYVYHYLGVALLRSENLSQAKVYFSRLQERIGRDSLSVRDWALFYAIAKDSEMAIKELQNAVKIGCKDIDWIRQESAFDIIREDERYKQIISNLSNVQNNR